MVKQSNTYKQAYNSALRTLKRGGNLPSEPEMSRALSVSRTTVRNILRSMREQGLIDWDKRHKIVLRAPRPQDYFPEDEIALLGDVIERSIMQKLLSSDAQPGMQISELELAREIGVGTSGVREFLIRFSRFGLIEKRRNSRWVLKGFTSDFALELADIRELFELKSANAFVKLEKSDPAWVELEMIEQEHRELLANIGTNYNAFSPLDERFHRLIHSASKNRFIIDFYDVISMIFHYHYQWNKSEEFIRNKIAVEEHLTYAAALKSGDADKAELACRRHLRSARETLLASIPENYRE